MKHSSIRELFEYWNARRGRRPAPERTDIEPGAVRRVLADTFILSFEPRVGHPFRIAGTRVCALFARELKGEAFLDLWSVDSRSDMRTLLAIVAEETVGVVASVTGAGPGHPSTGHASTDHASTDHAPLGLELLLLPLSHHGRSDARVLGAIAPSEPPVWIGRGALRDLTVGTHRYVGATVDHARSVVPHPGRLLGRLRHGFVVYDGGQS
jgi:hypothetical protein